MRLIKNDYWWKTLVLDCPAGATDLTARVQVCQPQGYVQEMTVADVELRAGQAHVPILYPLVDEGRYDAKPGIWEGAWLMGEYRFDVELSVNGKVVAAESLTLDPHSFFPSDRMVISVDARPQIIECAPRQALYQDEDTVSFVCRIRRHRVTKCHVEVDVTRRGGTAPLAGPWRYTLTHDLQAQSFSTAGWDTGEYWIRLRPLVDGQPVGPYCVRKFWKQVSAAPEPPAVLELAGHPEVLVDDYCFEAVNDIQFVPDALDKHPDRPLVSPTQSHEEEMLSIDSLAWNDGADRYEATYRNSGGRIERQDTHEERLHLKMLLISADGEQWHKPTLGLVDYDGSTDNNILRDDRDNPDDAEREKAHDIEHAEFRFYDPERDGPVNLDNVFVASGKQHFPFRCKSIEREDATDDDDDAFRPRGGEFWPFEQRGDLYLVLTREPILYLGIGMDLMHTSETIRCHAEGPGNGSDRTRLYFYFRPASPAYPPHGAPCDNLHLGLRNLAVMWTDDGITYHRQFVLAPDGHDRLGTQFYAMGLLQRFGTLGDAPGRPVLDKGLHKINQAFPQRNLYLGSVLVHWGIEQTQEPELIWTRDLLHFKRFTTHRHSLIESSGAGTYNCGMIRDRYMYSECAGQWWYHYTAINTRHNGYGIMARWTDLAQLQRERPNHADVPYFTTWEGHWADGKQTKYLPAIARCQPYRVAHAEPRDVCGDLTTRPIRVDGDELRLNAATERGGSIRVELTDEAGQPLGPEAVTFEGDAVDGVIADLSRWRGQLIRLRFTLDRARLYAFHLATPK